MSWATPARTTEVADSEVCSFCEKCVVRSEFTHVSFPWKFMDVHFVHRFCKSSTTAAAEYRQWYPRLRIPVVNNVFIRVHQYLRELGSSPIANHSAERTVQRNLEEDENNDMAQSSLCVSTRRISTCLIVPCMSLGSIICIQTVFCHIQCI